MKCCNLKFLLWLYLFAVIPGSVNAYTASTSAEKKFQVVFDESYHNYLPGQLMRIRVDFKNWLSNSLIISQELVVLDSANNKVWKTVINLELPPNGSTTIPLLIPVPKFTGIFILTTGDPTEGAGDSKPRFELHVLQPEKSPRLSRILVHTPDSEEQLNGFLKTWDIKAPTISWGQVLICGKKSWIRFAQGEQEIVQLVNRALKREMSVLFLDFGPTGPDDIGLSEMVLPYGVRVRFTDGVNSAKSFDLKPDIQELTYGFTSKTMKNWNGINGICVPGSALKFEGKDVEINALATSGDASSRFPVVELIPRHGKGKLYLSQIITEGRLDDHPEAGRRKTQTAAYDPMAVQFLLNLISATVGDNLLK
jgi:hypothetical protein